MNGKLLFFFVGLVMFIGWTTPAPAIYQKLTEDQRKEAISYGQRNVTSDTTEFLKEWVVVLEGHQGYAFIITEFLALANAAKELSLQQRPLNPFDIEDAIAQSSNKLVFRVTTLGNTIDFSKEYTAVVQAGGQVIQNTFWTNSEGEAFGDGKSRPAFIADSHFFFPAEGIDPNSRITLIVKDKEGNTVTQFEFDLSTVR